MNDIAQTILLLSGPISAAVVWWIKRVDDARKRIDDAKLRGRVDECERDRAELHAQVSNLSRELTEQRGCVNTLTALLGREINVG